MPTYQYRCLDCDHEFEIVQKMSDDTLKECSECNGKLKRLIGSGAGIIFKGQGFYTTDYRSDGYKKQAAQESKGSSDTKGKKKSEKTKPSESKSTAEKTK